MGHLWAAMGAKDLQRGTSRWFMWAQGRLLGHPGEPREAHPAAKGRQRGAKGRHRTTKTGQRWAKGSQNGPSRAPRRHQNGSKMDLAMVKTQNVKTSKNHWFFPSKWIGNQPRTCQKRSQRAPGRPSGGTESTNGRPDDRSGHGQVAGQVLARPRAAPWSRSSGQVRQFQSLKLLSCQGIQVVIPQSFIVDIYIYIYIYIH